MIADKDDGDDFERLVWKENIGGPRCKYVCSSSYLALFIWSYQKKKGIKGPKSFPDATAKGISFCTCCWAIQGVFKHKKTVTKTPLVTEIYSLIEQLFDANWCVFVSQLNRLFREFSLEMD